MEFYQLCLVVPLFLQALQVKTMVWKNQVGGLVGRVVVSL